MKAVHGTFVSVSSVQDLLWEHKQVIQEKYGKAQEAGDEATMRWLYAMSQEVQSIYNEISHASNESEAI